jgi:hypothetical protein
MLDFIGKTWGFGSAIIRDGWPILFQFIFVGPLAFPTGMWYTVSVVREKVDALEFHH